MGAASTFYVFDFDSTLVQVESLPELARLSLRGHPEKAERVAEIERITELTATGKMSMAEGLVQRIGLMDAHRKHLPGLLRMLRRMVTPSIKRNKPFFRAHRDRIYVLSNGFEEFVAPVAEQLGIRREHVFANAFVLTPDGRIVGFDSRRLLAHQDGKARQLRALGLSGEVMVIGDGWSDYKTKEAGLASRFYAFTENARRETVVGCADHVLASFDEFLYLHKFPMSISYPKNRIRVLLLEGIHPGAKSAFEKEGYSVETRSGSLSEEELAREIRGITLLGIRSRTQITETVLRAAGRLKGIGAFCIGVNQLDLDACSRRGVIVFNAPYSNTRSVVELALGASIMLARRAFDQSARLHRGVWEKTGHGFEIRGKKLGILGYGNIGSQLSVLAEAMGMDVHYYDVVEKLPLGNATKCSSLAELLRRVDVVSVHVDGHPRNANLIGEKQFRMMREGALFLNLSRGFVVDVAALAASLREGHLGGAAVDVFPEEPAREGESFASELQHLPNVVLTPHIGGSTGEAQQNVARSVSQALIAFVNTGSSFGSVNFPSVQLPQLRLAHRFIHVHRNEPGVLAGINRVMAEHGINIVGQHLKTNELIGYVITDVAKKYSPRVIEEMKAVPHTIHFRVLY
jgi:D-3-phosphoglycerate dehydrogenase